MAGPFKTSGRVTLTCLHCEQEFEKYQSDVRAGGGKFCSKECYTLSKRRPITINGDGTASVPLGNGLYATIDEADAERVAPYTWHFDGLYARCHQVGRMHRFLMGSDAGIHTDHIDGDKLNNRRSNLRAATASQNCANRDGFGKSRFKGVYWEARRGKWTVGIKVARKKKWVGRFNSEEEAARAYDAAAVQYFGEFARLNFPSEQGA